MQLSSEGPSALNKKAAAPNQRVQHIKQVVSDARHQREDEKKNGFRGSVGRSARLVEVCDHGQHGTHPGRMVVQGISGFAPWDKCARQEVSVSGRYIQTQQFSVAAVEMQCGTCLATVRMRIIHAFMFP
jgi:hypothetical protein